MASTEEVLCDNKKRPHPPVLVSCSVEGFYNGWNKKGKEPELRDSKLRRSMLEVLGLTESLSPWKGWAQ